MTTPARWLGFFGKLPAQADFVGRGLPPDVQAAFDEAMSQWLARRRADDAAGWLQAYLDSPAWRFVWPAGSGPGVLAGQDCAGVLLPSVDAVGRYFPLLLAVGLPPGSLPAQPLGELLERLAALEALGLQALDEEWQPDALQAALAEVPLAGWPVVPEVAAGEGDLAADWPPADLATGLDALARRAWLAQQAGQAFWWSHTEAWRPCLLSTPGVLGDDLPGRLFGLQGLAAADLPLSSAQ